MEHVLFTLMLYTAMGVETRVPDETALGAEYPNYDELSPEWKGQDRVFVHKELFDEMATGLLLFFCSTCYRSLCWIFIPFIFIVRVRVILRRPVIGD